MGDFDDLERRMDRLEAELADIRHLVETGPAEPAAVQASPAAVSLPGPSPAPAPAATTPPSGAPAAAAGSAAAGSARAAGDIEANLAGKWLARAGAAALFVGAALAFMYAVDRGLISPLGRVVVGLLVGLGFVGWAEWAYRRTWASFAQAVAGIGVAVGYLAIWAGYQLYDLMSALGALALLALVVIGGGALAVRHDSVALAVLAALGGFLNPLLVSTGRGMQTALYSYVLLLDLGVLGLSYLRGWRALSGVALASTWLLVWIGAVVLPGDKTVALTFTTLFVLLFHASFVVGRPAPEPVSEDRRPLLIGFNAVGYFLIGLSILDPGAHAAFALLAGLAHAGGGAALGRVGRADGPVVLTLVSLGVAFITAGAGFEFDGPILATVWALEAVAVAAASRGRGLSKLKRAAAAVFGLSVVTSVVEYELGLTYLPEAPLVSVESLPFAVQTLALTLAALTLRRSAEPGRSADTAAVLVNVFLLAWMTLELRAAALSSGWSFEAFTFLFSTLWTLYACGLLAFGIGRRAKWARLMAISLFSLVVVKLVLSDVWLLETLMRVAALVGLGFALLLGSLSYHRFRALILAGVEDPS